MTTSTSRRHTSNTDDTIVEAGHSHGITTSAALYYPSFIGNCWVNELLPSGDLCRSRRSFGIGCYFPNDRPALGGTLSGWEKTR